MPFFHIPGQHATQAPRFPFVIDWSDRRLRDCVAAITLFNNYQPLRWSPGHVMPERLGVFDAERSGAGLGAAHRNTPAPHIQGCSLEFIEQASPGRASVSLGTITSADPLSLAGQSDVSVVASVTMRNSFGSTFPRIIDKSNGGGAAQGWAFYPETTNPELRFQHSSFIWSRTLSGLTGHKILSCSLTGLTAGTPTVSMFENGQKRTTLGSANQSGSTTISSSTTDARVGNWNHDWDRQWDGLIDHVLVFNGGLLDDEHASFHDPATRWSWVEEYGRRAWFLPAGGATAINATLAALDWQPFAAAVNATTQVAAALASSQWAAQAAAVGYVQNTDASLASVAWTANAATINATTQVAATLAQSRWTALPATVTAGTQIDAALALASWTASPADVSLNVHLAPALVSVQWQALSAQVIAGTNIAATLALAAWTPHAATVNAATQVDASLALADWTTFQATVAAGAAINATLAQAQWTTHAAAVSLDTRIEAAPSSVTWTPHAATVNAATNIAASTASAQWTAAAAAITDEIFPTTHAAIAWTTHAATVAVGNFIQATTAAAAWTTYPCQAHINARAAGVRWIPHRARIVPGSETYAHGVSGPTARWPSLPTKAPR